MEETTLMVILITWFIMANVVSLQHAFNDYRKFDRLVEQCEKQGFIQDKTIRIKCAVEK